MSGQDDELGRCGSRRPAARDRAAAADRDDHGSRRSLLALALLALAACGRPTASAPTPIRERVDAGLEAKLREAVAGFRGTVGVYVRHLPTGRTAAINADTIFPTASMIKVPILVGVYDAARRGALDLHQTLTYRDSLLYAGEDIIGALRDSARISLTKVAMLMITTSDNTGSLWLQHLAGTGTTINEWLAAHGFEATRVNSRTPGREADRRAFGWGQTTPREMARLVTMIREGRAVSPAASEEMYRALTRIYWNGESLSQLPPWVQAASKQGAVDRSRSEVVLVNAPSGDYVFCVITKNQTDERYDPDNEGYVLLRRVSALLWAHFEPGHPWTPAPGAERLKP
ncbi:MAG: serine hydrolase [Gemmatimonadales bacterium]|nr:serine hydrolase [Gemmatimonadales bacterium]